MCYTSNTCIVLMSSLTNSIIHRSDLNGWCVHRKTTYSQGWHRTAQCPDVYHPDTLDSLKRNVLVRIAIQYCWYVWTERCVIGEQVYNTLCDRTVQHVREFWNVTQHHLKMCHLLVSNLLIRSDCYITSLI